VLRPRSAQNCIVASLAAQFPGLAVVGEEGEQDLTGIPADWVVRGQDQVPSSQIVFPKFANTCSQTNTYQAALSLPCPARLAGAALQELTVWVDPLDGTAEYTQVG
jgi:3'(2'), 5'-bisphosphate nucleotidase